MTHILEIFKILSDKTRLEIVLSLSSVKELSCAEISAQFKHLSQPTLSHHFKTLAEAGLIAVRKDGTSHFYSLNKKVLKESGIDVSKIK